MSDLPGWTCPAIDRVIAIVEAHVPEPDRTEARICLEEVRVAHVRLRHVASGSNAQRTEREVARLEAQIAALLARYRAADTG